MGWKEELAKVGVNIGDVVGVGTTIGARQVAQNNLQDVTARAQGNIDALKSNVAGKAEFKPFSVTSGVGGQTSYDVNSQGQGQLNIGAVPMTTALQTSAGSDLSMLGSGMPSSLFNVPQYQTGNYATGLMGASYGAQPQTGGYRPTAQQAATGYYDPVTGGYMTGQDGSGQLGQIASGMQQSINDGTYQYGGIGQAFEAGQITAAERDALSNSYYQSPVSRTPMNQQARVDLHAGLGNERSYLAPTQQQYLGQTSMADLAMQQSAQAMQNQAGSSVTQQGMGLMGAGQSLLNTQTPDDLARLQTAFGTQALQAPTTASQGLLGLGEQTTALAQQQLGEQATDVSNAYSGISAPDVRTGAGSIAEQYAQAGSGMLSADTPTANSIYDQIRATQTPEEERQRISMENRLAAQGRLGVQTDMYGTTPEEFAMNKAQAEARNAASLQSMQMADALATSQQARAAQLSQLGLSAEQVQAQLDSEGFGQQMSLAGSQLQTAQTQEALQASSQNRAAQLAQLGLSTEQIASQLQSEGLSRTTSAAGTAAQLAQTGAGIQAQQQQLGSGLLGLGLQAQQLGGALGSQDVANAATLFGIGQQSTLMPSQLEAAQIANINAQLQGSNIPYQQQLAALQASLQTQQLAQAGQLADLDATSQLGVAELNMLKELGLAEGTIDQDTIKALGNIFSGTGK